MKALSGPGWMTVGGTVPLSFRVELIRDGASWIVRGFCNELRRELPEFCVEGSTEEEAWTAVEAALSKVSVSWSGRSDN